MPETLPRAKPRGAIRASHINDLAVALEAARQTRFEPSQFDVARAGGVRTIRLAESITNVRTSFWAQLDNNSSPFSWTEQDWDDATNAFQDKSNGRSGTTNAYHHGGYGTLPTGLYVLMREIINDVGAYEYVFMIPHDGDAGDQTRQDNFTDAEGTTTADSNSWAIETSQGTNFGVVIPVVTRVVYDHSGDETLYGFTRDLTFDAGGRLLSASAETRYTIDAPEDC